MRTTVLIEGILLLAISFLGIGEGLRIIGQRDPKAVSDILGPGIYVLFLSIPLMITSIVYLFVNYGNVSSMKEGIANKETSKQKMPLIVVYMVAVFIIYIILIYIFGYLVSTIIFFFLEFKLFGVKSWITNTILTLAAAVLFYFVFIYYCSMVFPRGIFWAKFWI